MTEVLPFGRITIDSDSKEFWERVRARELALQRCTTCGLVRYVPRRYCRSCLGDSAEWVPVSGQGTVYSFTVQHPTKGRLAEHAPYVVVLVELAEGPRMWSNLVGTPPQDVRIGMPVTLFYEELDGEVLPRFRAA